MARKQRVLILATAAETVHAFFSQQVSALAAAGFDVYTAAGPSTDVATSMSFNTTHFDLPFSRAFTPLADCRGLYQAYGLLRTLRPDIVHCYTSKAGMLGVLAAYLAGIKVRLYTFLGFPAETASATTKRVLISAERLTCTLATRVYAISPSLRLELIRSGILAPTTLHLSPAWCFGVDTDHFDRNAVSIDAREQYRQAVGIDERDVVVGYVGRLAADKGLDTLSKAWALVQQSHSRTKLLIHGRPDSRDPTSPSVIRQLRADRSVIFSPLYVPDIRVVYQAMDLLVLPSRREGLPTAVLEAGAMSLPVVASRSTGCVDIVVDGLNGLLFKTGDPLALARSILHLSESKQRREQMGRTARNTVATTFSSTRACEELISEYGRLLQTVPLLSPEALPA